MWSGTFITTFRNLSIENKAKEYEMMPGVKIVCGRKKEKYLNTEFRLAAGMIEYTHFKEADHIIIFEADNSFNTEKLPPSEMLKIWLVWISWLLTDSWLVTDNAIDCEVAYLRAQTKQNVTWSNNGLFTQYSTAIGEKEKQTKLTEKELADWNVLCEKTRSRVFENGTFLKHTTTSGSKRLSRFFSFIDTSRKNNNPAMKIAFCCSALESLFSTSTTELTHRLSERIAFLMGEYGEGKEETYDLIKECYSVRSVITHGAATKKPEEEIQKLSSELLDLLRKISVVIFENPEIESLLNGKNERIDSYFKKLTFS